MSQLRTSLPLALSDALVILASLFIWNLLGFAPLSNVASALFVVASLLAYSLAGLYPGIALHPVSELRRCSVASFAVLAMLAVTMAASSADRFVPLAMLALVAPVIFICVPLFRSFARRLWAGSDRWAQPAIVFGTGKQSAEIFNAMAANRRCGLRPLGFVDGIQAQWVDTDMHPNWYLGTAQDAAGIAADADVYWAIVCGSVEDTPGLKRSLDHFASAMPHRLYAEGAFPIDLNHSAQTRSLGLLTLLYQRDLLALPGPRIAKRLLDLAISLTLAIVVFPLMLVIGMLIKGSSSGPVIYAHERIGRGGKSFKTLKFRTMRSDAAQVLETYLSEHPELNAEWQEKHKLTVDPRVTRLGGVLRKSSLDELPQLINVLKGDMSLVGPRPIVENEIARYDDAFDSYCRVPPGIAGLWQVSGRNNTSYEDRVEYDRFYVQNWSPWLDLYLLARTIKVVVTQDGAY